MLLRGTLWTHARTFIQDSFFYLQMKIALMVLLLVGLAASQFSRNFNQRDHNRGFSRNRGFSSNRGSSHNRGFSNNRGFRNNNQFSNNRRSSSSSRSFNQQQSSRSSGAPVSKREKKKVMIMKLKHHDRNITLLNTSNTSKVLFYLTWLMQSIKERKKGQQKSNSKHIYCFRCTTVMERTSIITPGGLARAPCLALMSITTADPWETVGLLCLLKIVIKTDSFTIWSEEVSFVYFFS